jgi:hypothetical protein
MTRPRARRAGLKGTEPDMKKLLFLCVLLAGCAGSPSQSDNNSSKLLDEQARRDAYQQGQQDQAQQDQQNQNQGVGNGRLRRAVDSSTTDMPSMPTMSRPRLIR